ncbi:MAG: hypothetical protein JHC95_03735 [Solirubrobacteraceae bacterium]|nr:hypothetical protein [Solirubrobacteraceae bacterium]
MTPPQPQPFAVQVAAGCPGHLDIALALAAEFREIDVDEIDAQVDLVALELADAASCDAHGQLEAVATAMRAFTVVETHVGVRDILVDDVLATCEGSPLALAPIAVEAAHRAGILVGIIGDGTRHLIAHCELEDPVALDFGCPRRPPRIEAVDERSLSWRCAHQLAFATLAELIERGTRGGDMPLALKAADLRLDLPLTDESRRAQQGALDRLRAVLN